MRLLKLQAKEIMSRIKKAFVDNLPNVEWMDDKTRAAAVGKVSVTVMSHSLVISSYFFTNRA